MKTDFDFSLNDSLNKEIIKYLNRAVIAMKSDTLLHFDKKVDEQLKKAVKERLGFYIGGFEQDLVGLSEEELRQSFPTLFSEIKQVCFLFISFLKETICRLEQNKEKIEKSLLFGKPIQTIQTFNFAGADVHNGGRVTVQIVTDAGCFVYKPHDVRQDAFLSMLLSKHLGDVVRVPSSIPCEDAKGRFGFCEFIVNHPSETWEEAKQYFFHMGGLVAVTAMFGCGDFHYENILSDGKYPIPVDLETGFCPEYSQDVKRKKQSKDDKFLGKTSMFNVMYPHKLQGIKEISPLLSTSQQNKGIPRIDGVAYTVQDFKEDYYAGMEQVYRYGIKHKEELIAELESAPDFEVRTVLRPTNYYAKTLICIHAKGHFEKPNYAATKLSNLLDINPRQIDDRKWKKIVISEKEALLAGDIPYFYTTAHGVNVYNQNGLVAEGVFAQSPIARAIGMLKQFGEEMLQFELGMQHQMLDKAIIPMWEHFDEKPEIYDGNPEMVLKKILDDGIPMSDGHLIWFGNHHHIDRLNLTPQYYYGTLGMLIPMLAFLKQHPKSTFEKAVDDVYQNALKIIEQDVRCFENSETILYPEFVYRMENGAAGIIRALMQMRQYKDDPKLLSLAKAYAKQLCRLRLDSWKDISLRNGIAGALYVLSIYKEPLDIANESIRCFADYLMQSAKIEENGKNLWDCLGKHRLVSGLDLGMAGVGYALYVAGKAIKEPVYLRKAEEAFTFEREIYNPEKGGWMDMSDSSVLPGLYGGYHSGNVGLGFLWIALDDKTQLEKAVEGVLKSSVSDVFSDCLENGNLGACDFLIEAGRILNRPELIKEAENRLKQMEERGMHYISKIYHQVYEVPLFTGDAGRMYIKMRLENPNTIKSVLRLE